MQGKKGEYQEQLFINFQLSKVVPADNFYRRLKDVLDLSYLHKMTEKYYGTEGRKSIDAEVFFKLMLIGYLENINSDRKLIEQASMRMDMLYFLDHNVDEALPWHSTLSRTRKLFGKEIFLELFRHILKMCIEKGMVCGKTQAVDSAFIKANASMDSLEERSTQYYDDLTENEDIVRLKVGKRKKNKDKKFNEQYVSNNDPDAKVSTKPGKPSALNYLGIVSVDTKSHIICGANADLANKRDSETIEEVLEQTIENLEVSNIEVKEVTADTNYSSGKTYKYCEEQNITPYIPVTGSYIPKREDFIYDKEADCYICKLGIKLSFKSLIKKSNKKVPIKVYKTLVEDCCNCLLKDNCCNASGYKKITHSVDKPYYDIAYERMNTNKGKQMMRLRSSTVEPVLGTLLNFGGMKKVYTKGIILASKHILMASMAYNLKKYMNFNSRKSGKAMANTINMANNFILSSFLKLFQTFSLQYI